MLMKISLLILSCSSATVIFTLLLIEIVLIIRNKWNLKLYVKNIYCLFRILNYKYDNALKKGNYNWIYTVLNKHTFLYKLSYYPPRINDIIIVDNSKITINLDKTPVIEVKYIKSTLLILILDELIHYKKIKFNDMSSETLAKHIIKDYKKKQRLKKLQNIKEKLC